MKLPIKGVTLRILKNTIVVKSEESLKILSSAVLNGGLTESTVVINHKAPRRYHSVEPHKLLRKAVVSLGLPESTVGLMTAADLAGRRVSSEEKGSLKVVALATSGVSYPAAAGDEASKGGGTINIIVVVDGNMTEACLVNSVMTATEAKALALKSLDVRSRFSSEAATGTTSDAVVIACTKRGEVIEYAGSATDLGGMIGRTVRRAVEESLRAGLGSRSLAKRLEERGITLTDLVDAGMELYVPSPEGEDRLQVESTLREALPEAMDDCNVSALMMAAARLQEDGEHGLIPSLASEEFNRDPVHLVADETIGMALANYLAGTLGVHNYLRYDRFKPGVMGRLGPFLDDAVGGLVAGVLTKVMGKHRSGKM